MLNRIDHSVEQKIRYEEFLLNVVKKFGIASVSKDTPLLAYYLRSWLSNYIANI